LPTPTTPAMLLGGKQITFAQEHQVIGENSQVRQEEEEEEEITAHNGDDGKTCGMAASLESLVEQLKKEKEELQTRLRAMDYLEMDRRQLNKEVAELLAQNEALTQENDIFRKQNSRLSGETQVLRSNVAVTEVKKQSILKSQLEAIIAERWVATNDDQKLKDEEFRQRFNLPKGEYSLFSYSCADKSLRRGTLHITLQYLCWKGLSGSGVLGAEDIVLPIAEIESLDKLDKVRAVKILPRKGRAMDIKMLDGKVVRFTAFFSRKEAIQKIEAQARILGHQIRLLRLGVPDDNTGICCNNNNL